MKLIFATHNPGKLKEMKAFLSDLDIEVQSAYELGLDEPVEDGNTFAENAHKKAKHSSQKLNAWAVADDSGICIEALNGAPGIQSARWAGINATDEAKVQLALNKMKDIPADQRQAWMKCAVALVSPEGKHWIFNGKVMGEITFKTRGKPRPRLLYDLIFVPQGESKTFSEMSDEEKNRISHRGIAFGKVKKFLKTIVG